MLYLTPILDAWDLIPILDMLYLTYDTWHLILDTWCLICYTWHLISDTWYLTPALDMLSLDTWYLTLDIWHMYLTYYYLTPDTWHLIYDTWQLTWYPSLDMLSPGTSTHDLILWHLTRYYYTWHLYYIVYSWLSLLRGLGMIIILLPDLWYYTVLLNSCAPELLCSWTPVSLNPCNREIPHIMLQILYSCWSRNWIIMDVGLQWTPCGHYLWTIYIMKYSTYPRAGETDGYRYDVIFIMVIFLKCHVGRIMISPRKQ